MRERPLLLDRVSIRAVLGGRKTQLRSAIKNIPWRQGCNPNFTQARAFPVGSHFRIAGSEEMTTGFCCPYGVAGDRLWVRESWQFEVNAIGSEREQDGPFVYAADDVERGRRIEPRWRPSIHMPRWACRLVLQIEEVKAHRLQRISDEDIRAEGIEQLNGKFTFNSGLHQSHTARESFRSLWDSARGNWDDNPWVWAITFSRMTA